MRYQATQHMPCEWSYTSPTLYTDPFHDVTLDVLITGPDDRTQRVPAFWAGEQTWSVRYAPHLSGSYRFHTECSDTTNPALHGVEGRLDASPYTGSNPLLRHGPLQVGVNRRHLEHSDGTPFFWLGDTWWMMLTKRITWPEDLHTLTADRVAKGFTVIQLVAGLFPDMPALDARGDNEAGQAWEPGFRRINPAFFDLADLRIAHLVRSGLLPCIFGSWGYYMDAAGPDALRAHWRNLIARWGAYPVVWCVAGEGLMPFYLDPIRNTNEVSRAEWQDRRRAAWSDLARFIRATDPYGHPITIHPTRFGHDQVDDPSVLDLDMLQTGHSGHGSQAPTIDMLEAALAHTPRMPVLVGEVSYEGILEGSREEVQRFLVWTCLLSGAAGHTYGANGLWQANTREVPFGPSPHGTAWGNLPWEDAYRLPGAGQVGVARRVLERYPWWRFEGHPEWVEPHHTRENRIAPYAAGIPGEVRVVFIPASHAFAAAQGRVSVRALEPKSYRATLVNPSTGETHDLGVTAGADYVVPTPPVVRDWVLVLEV